MVVHVLHILAWIARLESEVTFQKRKLLRLPNLGRNWKKRSRVLIRQPYGPKSRGQLPCHIGELSIASTPTRLCGGWRPMFA